MLKTPPSFYGPCSRSSHVEVSFMPLCPDCLCLHSLQEDLGEFLDKLSLICSGLGDALEKDWDDADEENKVGLPFRVDVEQFQHLELECQLGGLFLCDDKESATAK